MNCPFCGAPLEEGAKFCTNCGAKLQAAAQSAAESAGPAPAPENNAFAGGGYQPPQGGPSYGGYQAPQPLPVSESPVWKALRSTLSSPVFLILAILLTCNLASTLYTSFIGARATNISANSVTLAVSTVLASLPLVLYTIGTWLLWGTSKGTQPLKGTGAIRTGSIIMAVLSGFALCILAIALTVFGAAWRDGRIAATFHDSSKELEELMAIFDGSLSLYVFFCGLLLVMMFLVMLYFIKMSRLAKTIRKTDETGLQTRPISWYLNFVHGLMILSIVGSVITVLASAGNLKKLLAKYGLADMTFMGVIQTAVAIALPLVLFIAIHSLKKNLKNAV